MRKTRVVEQCKPGAVIVPQWASEEKHESLFVCEVERPYQETLLSDVTPTGNIADIPLFTQ